MKIGIINTQNEIGFKSDLNLQKFNREIKKIDLFRLFIEQSHTKLAINQIVLSIVLTHKHQKINLRNKNKYQITNRYKK
ncbi:hypothetical protein DXV75_10935 [Alteromonas aestuariivivens]|uniref:Uncharacterized protein n=1 Tax=Alteromonas aestuariivivens TaxID=1938339 RepID=A0A3D8M625_9ALTE|nr:hypothetical protein DXV75_10935 [Alteromonas aestuariivivens]